MMQVAVISPLTATLDGLFAYQVISPKAASLAVKDVLECTAEEVQKHLKTFFEVMNTSPPHVTYTSGTQHTSEMVCSREKGVGLCAVGGSILTVTGYHGYHGPAFCTVGGYNAVTNMLSSCVQGLTIATGAVWQSMLVCR